MGFIYLVPPPSTSSSFSFISFISNNNEKKNNMGSLLLKNLRWKKKQKKKSLATTQILKREERESRRNSYSTIRQNHIEEKNKNTQKRCSLFNEGLRRDAFYWRMTIPHSFSVRILFSFSILSGSCSFWPAYTRNQLKTV